MACRCDAKRTREPIHCYIIRFYNLNWLFVFFEGNLDNLLPDFFLDAPGMPSAPKKVWNTKTIGLWLSMTTNPVMHYRLVLAVSLSALINVSLF